MSGARFRFVRRVLPSISTTCIAAYAHRNAGPAAISVFQRRSTMTRTATKPYNYLIVGGGTAGLVVARRLSEDGTKRVLVLEAGASRLDDDNINVPGHLGQLFGNPQYDWDFSSVPQPHIHNRIIAQPRGKVLGGSSAMNFMAVLYPSRQDFESWAALGNPGWGAEDMAQYLRKFHTFYPSSPETRNDLALDTYLSEEAQGKDGPLAVTIRDSTGDFASAWLKAFRHLGFNDSSDPIDGQKLGAFTPPSSIDPATSTRSHAATAYYPAEVAARPNLEVRTDTFVEKVILETPPGATQPQATGVQVRLLDGSRTKINASEVILAAGAFQSPQILELSGIGSSAVLAEQKIPVLVDNPGVGENFQDHPFASVSFEVAEGQISGDVLRDPQVVAALWKQYQESRTGPFGGTPMSAAYLPVVDHDGRLSSEQAEQLINAHLYTADTSSASLRAQHAVQRQQMLLPDAAEFQFTMMSTQMHYHRGRTSIPEALAKTDPRNMVTILVTLNHPLSRGTVHIQSPKAADPPRIDPAYLSQQLDLELLARGVQFLDRVTATNPLRSLLKPASRIPDAPDLASLDRTKETVRERLFTNFHPVGTCAMLPRELNGVVDSRLRVYGVEGLRVVDASIFPLLTQGNIQAAVYAVAEKAADLIREEW